jgi:hypothetical protein
MPGSVASGTQCIRHTNRAKYEFRSVELQTLKLFLAREGGRFEDQATSEQEADCADINPVLA